MNAPAPFDLAGPGRRLLAPSEVVEYKPIPLAHEGRPAMALLTWVGEPSSLHMHRGYVLVEGSDGLPYGYRAFVSDYVLTVRRDVYDEPRRLGTKLACQWLDGTLHRMSTCGRGGVAACDGPGPDGIPLADAIRAAIPEAGFSPSFVDLLDCVSRWHASQRLSGPDFALLCGDGAREAALRAFCRANPMLACAGSEGIASRFRMGAAVDAGSLVPDIGRAKVRVLAGPAWDPVGLGEANFDAMLSMILALPVDWLPGDREGVEAFAFVSSLVAACAGPGFGPSPVLRPSRGDWKAFAARCVAAGAGNLGTDRSRSPVPYLDDPMTHMARVVVAPALKAHAGWRLDARACMFVAPRIAHRLMYGGKGLPAIIRTATEWHRVLERLQREIPHEAPSGGWPALIPDATVGDVALRCLTTPDEVREEGLAGPGRDGVPGLDHCVATYMSEIEAGRCHIVSLRRVSGDGRGERLSTAELRQSPDGTVEVRQHSGRGNSEPPEGCREALSAYVAREVPFLPPRPPRQVEHLRAQCGYDPDDPELVARACRAYARFLPRGLREPAALAAWAVSTLGIGDQ